MRLPPIEGCWCRRGEPASRVSTRQAVFCQGALPNVGGTGPPVAQSNTQRCARRALGCQSRSVSCSRCCRCIAPLKWLARWPARERRAVASRLSACRLPLAAKENGSDGSPPLPTPRRNNVFRLVAWTSALTEVRTTQRMVTVWKKSRRRTSLDSQCADDCQSASPGAISFSLPCNNALFENLVVCSTPAVRILCFAGSTISAKLAAMLSGVCSPRGRYTPSVS